MQIRFLIIALMVQIIDMRLALEKYQTKFIKTPKYSLKMDSGQWKEIARKIYYFLISGKH